MQPYRLRLPAATAAIQVMPAPPLGEGRLPSSVLATWPPLGRFASTALDKDVGSRPLFSSDVE